VTETPEDHSPITRPTSVQLTRRVRVLDLIADCDCPNQPWHVQGCMFSGLENHPWTKAA